MTLGDPGYLLLLLVNRRTNYCAFDVRPDFLVYSQPDIPPHHARNLSGTKMSHCNPNFTAVSMLVLGFRHQIDRLVPKSQPWKTTRPPTGLQPELFLNSNHNLQ